MLVVASALTQATNDKQQVVPMLEQLQALPKELGRVKRLLADTGYASEDNVNACAQAKIRPLIALGREAHHGSGADFRVVDLDYSCATREISCRGKDPSRLQMDQGGRQS